MDVEYLAAAEWCSSNQSAIMIDDRDLTISYVESLAIDTLPRKPERIIVWEIKQRIIVLSRYSCMYVRRWRRIARGDINGTRGGCVESDLRVARCARSNYLSALQCRKSARHVYVEIAFRSTSRENSLRRDMSVLPAKRVLYLKVYSESTID